MSNTRPDECAARIFAQVRAVSLRVLKTAPKPGAAKGHGVRGSTACSTKVQQPDSTLPTAANRQRPDQDHKDLQRPCRLQLRIRRRKF
jgi:hypothetical protein